MPQAQKKLFQYQSLVSSHITIHIFDQVPGSGNLLNGYEFQPLYQAVCPESFRVHHFSMGLLVKKMFFAFSFYLILQLQGNDEFGMRYLLTD